MPVLHKYKDKSGYYVVTSIKKTLITFQLTPNGEKRLESVGIRNGQAFRRGLLLDLYRSGDAYTHGSGPGQEIERIDIRQLKLFDSLDDPDPETLFPTCATCSSPIGLHLVEIKDKDHLATILCYDCRFQKLRVIYTSVPIEIINRSVLKHIIETKKIDTVDSSVTAYKDFLDTQFKTKWDEIAKSKSKKRAIIQEELFKEQQRLIK